MEWRDQVHAYFAGHDTEYVHLLLWLEKMGRRSFRPEDMLDLCEDLKLTNSDVIAAKNALYTMFCKYTSGSVKRAFRRRKVRGVFEQYRKTYYQGMSITPKSLFAEKARAWKVSEAKWEDVDDAIDEWESRLEFLDEHPRD